MMPDGIKVVWVGLFLLVAPGFAWAQSGPADAGTVKDPLAARQEIVRDRMTQLEDRMYRLAEKLKATEPEQAKRLEAALHRAREQLLRRLMDESIDLLDKGELTEAADRQAAVLAGLEGLMKALTEEEDGRDERAKAIERLKAIEERILQLLDQQKRLKGATDGQGRQDAQGAKGLADKQRELQKRAAELADRMKGGASSQPSDGEGTTKPATDRSKGDSSKRLPSNGKDEGGSQKGKPSSGDPRQGAQGSPSDPQPSRESPSLDGQGGQNGQDQEPAPGADSVEQAGQHMGDAADKLGAQNRGDASQDQQKAIDQLERAKRELEESLDQLRREQQEQMLAGLESRFRSMLIKQTTIKEGTVALQAKGPATWAHADELKLAGLVQEETGLAGEAEDALRILREEGTTIVVPRLVEQLREDMLEIARRLKDKKTDEPTQQMMAEIIASLEELIDSVKQLRQQIASGESPSGEQGQGAESPLLPASAELKLLRSCQVRVNRQTAEHEKLASEGTDRDRLMRRTADRQRQVAEMARKMNEKGAGQ
ncbi:MAG TPA: hypothetical protein PKY77_05310 [Phycisphaerae bacterium]|nr:hypothetical protein [Phycisphaerae bacterium]HRY68931.1 hypothetical protein [Phycisphaerae bacterium]HSA25758.1 hypothetical protein [Phycisphaerae bacterium]